MSQFCSLDNSFLGVGVDGKVVDTDQRRDHIGSLLVDMIVSVVVWATFVVSSSSSWELFPVY